MCNIGLGKPYGETHMTDDFEMACKGLFRYGKENAKSGQVTVTIEVDGRGTREYPLDTMAAAEEKIQELLKVAYANGLEQSMRISVRRTEFTESTWFDGRVLSGFRMRDRMALEESQREPAPETAQEPAPMESQQSANPASAEDKESHGQTMVAAKLQRPKKSLVTKQDWERAVEWARRKGVDLRRGNVSRPMLITRVHDAGLWEAWNEKWPDLAFDENGYRWAVTEMAKRKSKVEAQRGLNLRDTCQER